MSTMHHDKTNTRQKEKFEKIPFFNEMKYGVDIIEKYILEIYTKDRRTAT